MRAQAKIKSAFVTTDTVLVTTTEAVAATIGNVANQSADGIIRFLGQAAITGGTSTTVVFLRVRRGNGITGAIVGEVEASALAGTANVLAQMQCEDTPGEVGGVPYSLTVQLVGAVANGVVNTASLIAIS